MKRLCEVEAELRPAIMRLGEAGDADAVRRWASLRCPHAHGCDQSAARCDGMSGQNLVTIARLEDRLFQHGFVRTNEKE